VNSVGFHGKCLFENKKKDRILLKILLNR